MGRKAIPQESPSEKRIPSGIDSILSVDSTNPTFCFVHFKSEYRKHGKLSDLQRKSLEQVLDWFQKLSSMTWGDIKKSPHVFHCHDIDPKKSTFPGFHEPRLSDTTPWQFKVADSARAVGYFDPQIQGLFHIVFINPNHTLYDKN